MKSSPPSFGGSSSRLSNYSRTFDLPDDLDSGASSDCELGGAMLPIFLNDLRRNNQQDLVEVTLELDNDSIVVCSVKPNPTSVTSDPGGEVDGDVTGILQRSLSATSRIRRKFGWLKSRSSRTTSSEIEDKTISARDARKIRAKLQRTRSGAQRALKGLRFISKTTGASNDANELWRRVESRFDSLAKDGLLAREDFGECIGMVDSKEFAVCIFDALARRKRRRISKISKEELHEFWLQITDQSFDARLQIFFDMVDSNEDGRITREEVQELIMLSASANKLSKLKEQAEEYASLIMEELDPENLGFIELWQVETLLLQRDTYMNYSRPLSTTSGGWSQNFSSFRSQNVVRRLSFKLWCLILENWQRVLILMLWMMTMACLFAWKFYQYKNRAAFQVMGYCVCTAKGAAETLKLNMALILLPVCRNTLTWLRSTRARSFIPFDDNINFHKIIASAIAIGVILHAGNHLLCDFPRLIYSSPEKFSLIASDFHNKKPTYEYLLTGVEGVTGIAMVVSVLPGNVFSLIMSKPQGFKYKSGQYIFLQCPAISSFEWHPFSITSAPGDDYLSVHIRIVGDWTQELKKVFTEVNDSPSVIGRAMFGQLGHVDQRGQPKLCVDGPYGAPAQDYQNYDVLLLVGLGIGATPFISILRDLLNNTRAADYQTDYTETSRSDDSSNSCASSTVTPGSKRKTHRTTNAHFYWVTREPGSFEWFKGVMDDVADMDHKGQIELHNYLTSVYEEGDARSTLITMVQALNHAKHGVDILSGTRVRTHFARPNWKEVFTKVAKKHPFATVGVFYCGMPVLAKELKKLCQELSHKTSTRFEFHKEHF
ncbi:hypothetical protein GH714_028069 [Hevea brasiliensis]|uniref:Uncharacterized protein n=1 Tax=Hevea brasiliensis TaxID=3981 RepID=A0A6A6LRT0_HEVBR|nr:hypothetical protein GH714_028069 [Hevea brasiliensis]